MRIISSATIALPHFPDPNADGVRVLGVPASIFCPLCAISLTHASVARERIFYCERCRGMLIAMGLFIEIVDDLRSRREISVQASHPADWRDLDRPDPLSEVQRDDGYAPILRPRQHRHRYLRKLWAKLARLRRTRPGRARAGPGGPASRHQNIRSSKMKGCGPPSISTRHSTNRQGAGSRKRTEPGPGPVRFGAAWAEASGSQIQGAQWSASADA